MSPSIIKNSYGLKVGDLLAGKYRVVAFLGSGWEGEVFKVTEIRTKIVRAAKFFHPKRDIDGKSSRMYAKKLDKLRNCPVLINYHTIEVIEHEGQKVTVFISEFVDGELLSDYLRGFRGQAMPVYQGMHLLHTLTIGMESIHKLKQYHGDLHTDNILIERFGLKVQLKLLDLYHSGRADKNNMQLDIIDIIKIFYDAIGGPKRYAKHPAFVKNICCGLKRGLILKKFPTIKQLRIHLESCDWS